MMHGTTSLKFTSNLSQSKS